MSVEKKRKHQDEVKRTTAAFYPKRHNRQNHFSILQEKEAEYREDAVMKMYEKVLTDDNFEMFVIYELRRRFEAIAKKFRPCMGDVFVTGDSDGSQLGMASTTAVSRLTLFMELTDKDIVHVTCGSMSNFVLDRQGRVFSWGSSDKGALARRTEENTDSAEERAERVTGFKPSKHGLKIAATSEDESICDVAAGTGHVLFLTRTGNVYVGGSYLLENRSWREEPPPDHPDEDDTATVLYEGAAPRGFREGPRHVFKMPSFVDRIYAGSSMSAARLVNGTLVTWGCDAKGELGRGSGEEICGIVLNPKNAAEEAVRFETMKDDFLIPKPVKFSEAIGEYVVLDVACGQNHMLVVVRLGSDQETRVYGTGLNQYGQLGLGDRIDRNVLTLIPDSLGKNIVSVSAGLFHSMFLDITGCHIYTCGRCDCGQLGIADAIAAVGDFRNTLQPLTFDIQDADEDLDFKQIAAGDNSCFAVTRTGKLYSWGFGDSGQLGHGADEDQLRATPLRKFAKDESGFILEVASGSQHTIVLANREMVKNNERSEVDTAGL